MRTHHLSRALGALKKKFLLFARQMQKSLLARVKAFTAPDMSPAARRSRARAALREINRE